MASTTFQTIALIPQDSDNTNRIATMRNIQNLNTSLTNSFSSYGGRITTLETNYTNLSNTVSSLNSSVNTANSNISTLQNQMSTANTNISTNTSNITTLQGQISTANSNITTLQGKVRYDLGIFSSGTCLSSERIFDFTSTIAFSLPANLSGSVAKARIGPAASFVLTIRKNGTSFGTITFAANALTGTISTTAQSFVAGDQIDIIAQSNTDALSDISITLAGTR